MSNPEDEITRREWLLRLSGAASLLGFSGVAGDTSAAVGQEASTAQMSTAQGLPPGLYEPSNDHMTHALMSDGRFVAIPPGSETDFVVRSAGPFKPRFFSAEEFPVVHRLIELVLGEADATSPAGPLDDTVQEIAEWIDLIAASAGGVRAAARGLSAQHRALAIAYYGSEVVQRLETAEPEKTWRAGLHWLAAESDKRHGRAFLQLSPPQQVDLLASLSDARPDRSSENAGTQLFGLLKRQTLQGFYTSQLGLKELDYKGNAFYGECPGCESGKG